MTEINEKLSEIKDLLSPEELERIGAKMKDPGRTVCPLKKVFVQMPNGCTGYQFVCPYLDRAKIECTHPEKKG